jgi:hypothetical protein
MCNQKMKIWAPMIVGAMAVALFTGAAQASSFTVATFADPSGDASDPLFTVNWVNATIDGGWADGKGNLLLEIPFTSASFANAWFIMDQLTITSTASFAGYTFGETGAGEIRFYQTGTTINPLLKISFDNAFVSRQAMGADDFVIENVTITGSAIPVVLSYDQFNFSFANVTSLPNQSGFTSTASFTSSAIPEPTTIAMFVFGLLPAIMKKKRIA